MSAIFADRQRYGRLKASIYFDSLNSLISPLPTTPYPSAELVPTLKKLLDLPVFTANDRNISSSPDDGSNGTVGERGSTNYETEGSMHLKQL